MSERWKKWHRPKIRHLIPTKWGWCVSYPEGLIIEKGVDIGYGTYIQAQAGVELQENVEIGAHCSIYSVSTIDSKKGRVLIKKNAKVGAHSIVMPGVTIGENTTVGALSFVNKSIPKNVVAWGIPAKVRRNL